MKTKKEITIGSASVWFPPVFFKVGTTCRLAKNQPEKDGEKQYWISLPKGFNGGSHHKIIKSYAKTCGFLVKRSEVF